MTPNQKFIAEKLLQGCYLVKAQPKWYRLRTPDHVVIRKISERCFKGIKAILRKKGDFYYIDKNKVRQLHGRCHIKLVYKSNQQSTHEKATTAAGA